MQEIKAKEKEVKQENIFNKLKTIVTTKTAKSYKVEGRKLKLILRQNALMKSVIYYAVTQKLQGGMEVMGWLVGKKYDDIVEITDAYIGNCLSSSSYTELDSLETIKMKKLAKKNGLILLGQWHCHPGMSTSPSYIDKDTMRTLYRFGLKNPLMLIVNDNDFWLGTIHNGFMKRIKFVIPTKEDNKIGLNLAYMNGEYKYNYCPTPFGSMDMENEKFGEFIDRCFDSIWNFFANIFKRDIGEEDVKVDK